MNRKAMASATAIVVCLGVFLSTPASAQSSAGATLQDATSQHHQKMYQMMRDMTGEMGKMTERMSQGALTPEQSRQMAQHMTSMSTMMRRMSGLASRPAMKNSDQQKQMDQMRKQMDEMMRVSKMMPGAK